jgi:chromosomal replication initiation ATPase DnaA
MKASERVAESQKELIKSIASYLNCNLNEVDKIRLGRMIELHRRDVGVMVKVRVKRVYVDVYTPHPPMKVAYVSLEQIAEKACEAYDITMAQLKLNSPIENYYSKKRRLANYANARQYFAMLAWNTGNTTLKKIGEFLGYSINNEHSGAINLLRKKKIHSNPILMTYLEKLNYADNSSQDRRHHAG